jgi:glutathione S-transferase
MALTLYHGHGSPYGWRVFLALEQLGIPYELKILSFSDKDTTKPEFVAINPRHRVPTIVDDGVALWESIPILEYLDERHGKGKLYPGSAADRARARRTIAEIGEFLDGEGLTPIFEEHFQKGDAPADAERVAKGREKMREELTLLAKDLKTPFFAGAAPGAVDFVLYPEVAYMKRITFRKPESKLAEAIPAPIAEWAKRIESLPYFDKTYPPHWR